MHGPGRKERREGTIPTKAHEYIAHKMPEPNPDVHVLDGEHTVVRLEPVLDHAKIVECTGPWGRWCFVPCLFLLVDDFVVLVRARLRCSYHHGQQLGQTWIGEVRVKSLLEYFRSRNQSSLFAAFFQRQSHREA